MVEGSKWSGDSLTLFVALYSISLSLFLLPFFPWIIECTLGEKRGERRKTIREMVWSLNEEREELIALMGQVSPSLSLFTPQIVKRGRSSGEITRSIIPSLPSLLQWCTSGRERNVSIDPFFPFQFHRIHLIHQIEVITPSLSLSIH